MTSSCLVLEACSDVACCTRRRRRVIDGRVETREHLCMMVSIDHDIIDGAPVARFTQRFTELIESGCGHFGQC